jgi:hypothetical protein
VTVDVGSRERKKGEVKYNQMFHKCCSRKIWCLGGGSAGSLLVVSWVVCLVSCLVGFNWRCGVGFDDQYYRAKNK